MNDKQTTALILLVIMALVFWLYNTQRLPSVVGAITGPSGTGGVDLNPGYDDTSNNGDFGFGVNKSTAPYNPSGIPDSIKSLPRLPGLPSKPLEGGKTINDMFGNPIKDKNGKPIQFVGQVDYRSTGTGLETQNTLNSIPIYDTVMSFLQPVAGSLPAYWGTA